MNATAAIYPRTGKVGWAIFVLALIGLALSAVSLANHYRKSATEFCDFGQSFNCDLVNRSIYSELSGLVSPTTGGTNMGPIGRIPVAAVGVLGYLALMLLSLRARTRSVASLMLLAALGGLAFALYLTWIEARLLFAWCILCLGSLAMISLITLLSGWQTARAWKG